MATKSDVKQLQRELDEVRSRELAGGRKMELDAQALRQLELRLTEALHLLEVRDREVSKREKEVQRREAGAVEIALEEARAGLRGELDATADDRRRLAMDRRRFSEEKAALEAEVAAVSALREMVRGLQGTLEGKDA